MRVYGAVRDASATIRSLLVVLVVGVTVACGDDDGSADVGPPDATGSDSGSADLGMVEPDLGPPAPGSWRAIYSEIVRPRCSCHLTGGGEGGLEMRDAAGAHAALVGVMALTTPCNDRTRVVEGDGAGSLLYQKVSGENLCGPRMPLGRDPLPQEEIDRIRMWIDDGARND